MMRELERFELADTGSGAVLVLGLNLTTEGHLGELNLQRLRYTCLPDPHAIAHHAPRPTAGRPA